MSTHIILAADHAGFAMKEHIKHRFEKTGYTVEDVGAPTNDPDDDYPMYMKKAAAAITAAPGSFGIVFGGSGQGEAIVMNRHAGIRAIVYAASNPELVKIGREHNNANVLSVGARFLSEEQAWVATEVFRKTAFSEDERHQRRLGQIDAS